MGFNGHLERTKDYAHDTIYDNTVSGLASINVQDAIDELAIAAGQYLTGNTAWVDETYGSDVTGTVGDAEHPYATIQAAITACGAVAPAPAADNRFIVRVHPTDTDYIGNLTLASFIDIDLGGAVVQASGINGVLFTLAANVRVFNGYATCASNLPTSSQTHLNGAAATTFHDVVFTGGQFIGAAGVGASNFYSCRMTALTNFSHANAPSAGTYWSCNIGADSAGSNDLGFNGDAYFYGCSIELVAGDDIAMAGIKHYKHTHIAYYPTDNFTATGSDYFYNSSIVLGGNGAMSHQGLALQFYHCHVEGTPSTITVVAPSTLDMAYNKFVSCDLVINSVTANRIVGLDSDRTIAVAAAATVQIDLNSIYAALTDAGGGSIIGYFNGINEMNTAWVDSGEGDDDLAVVGLRRRPFETIQGALDAIDTNGTASVDNRFKVQVEPGLYAEELTMYSFIDIYMNGAIIEADDGIALDFATETAISVKIYDGEIRREATGTHIQGHGAMGDTEFHDVFFSGGQLIGATLSANTKFYNCGSSLTAPDAPLLSISTTGLFNIGSHYGCEWVLGPTGDHSILGLGQFIGCKIMMFSAAGDNIIGCDDFQLTFAGCQIHIDGPLLIQSAALAGEIYFSGCTFYSDGENVTVTGGFAACCFAGCVFANCITDIAPVDSAQINITGCYMTQLDVATDDNGGYTRVIGSTIQGELNIDATGVLYMDSATRVVGPITKTAGGQIIYTGLKSVHEQFTAPALDGLVLEAAIAAPGTTLEVALDAQLNEPRNIQLSVNAGDVSTDIDITINGIRSDGQTDSETYEGLVQGSTDVQMNVGFIRVTSIVAAGFFSGAATVDVEAGERLGLSHRPIEGVYKALFNNVVEAIGTVDAARGTYKPTGVLDGTKPVDVWYRVTELD